MSTSKGKKKKFWHPDMLREETTSSSSNESNSLDQTDQFGGQTSPIPGPSYPETEPLPGPASIQQTQQDQFIPTVPALPQDTTDPRPGPSGIQQFNAETLPPDDSGWYETETKVFENENFTVFIQKQDHQRQKVFRLDDGLIKLVAAYAHTAFVHHAAQRNHADFRGAASNINHHGAASIAYRQTGTDRSRHRFFNQLPRTCTRAQGGLANRAALHLG